MSASLTAAPAQTNTPTLTAVPVAAATESPAPEILPFAVVKQTLEAATYTNVLREKYYTETLGLPMQAQGPFEIAFTLNVRDEGGNGVSGSEVSRNSFSISSDKGGSINFDKSRSSWSVRVIGPKGAATSYPLLNAAQNPYGTFTLRVLNQDQAQVILNGKLLPVELPIRELNFFSPDTQINLSLIAAPQAINKVSGTISVPDANNLTVIPPTPAPTPTASPTPTATSTPTNTPTRRPPPPTATPIGPPALDFKGDTPEYLAKIGAVAATLPHDDFLMQRPRRSFAWGGFREWGFMLPERAGDRGKPVRRYTGRGTQTLLGVVESVQARFIFGPHAWYRLRTKVGPSVYLLVDVPLTGDVELAAPQYNFDDVDGAFNATSLVGRPGFHPDVIRDGDAVGFVVRTGYTDAQGNPQGRYISTDLESAIRQALGAGGGNSATPTIIDLTGPNAYRFGVLVVN